LTAGHIPYSFAAETSVKLAIKGGAPIRTGKFQEWPIWDNEDEIAVLRSSVWSRAGVVTQAEQKFANAMGSKYCLLTTNGTNALTTALRVLGMEGGDEVITTPYSFIATIDAIFLNNALPVFADIDPDTWQIDDNQIEGKINQNTKVILPVHIIGGLCHMDKRWLKMLAKHTSRNGMVKKPARSVVLVNEILSFMLSVVTLWLNI